MTRYFDRDGLPMSMTEWAAKFEDLAYKRVAVTHLGPDKYVSTVWLGLDHSLTGAPPQIFETMAFGFDGFEVMFRYSTEEAAREGHYAAVRELVREPRNWIHVG